MSSSRDHLRRDDGVLEIVSLRQLARHASEIVHEVELLARPVLVTGGGQPAAYLIPIELVPDEMIASTPTTYESPA